MKQIIIESLLADYEAIHSCFQIKHFIVGASGDKWAQYKQALREIDARYNNLIDMEWQQQVAISASVKKKWYAVLGVGKQSVNKVLEKKNREISGIKKELARFIEIAEKLKAELGEITEERRYQLETESWKNKGIKMAAIDILATGRISNQTYDFVFSLPKESQLELFAKLSNQQPMALLGFEPDEVRAITRKLSNTGQKIVP